jgi:PPM family protein phosphatase
MDLTEATELRCAGCGASLQDGDRFCEQCGTRVGEGGGSTGGSPGEGSDPVAIEPGLDAGGLRGAPDTDRTVPVGCWSCGAGAEMIGEDGYCSICGMRERPPESRDELDLQIAAAVTDQGRRHHRNEDAFSLQVADGHRVVVVVCDGISTASAGNAAARTAAHTAGAILAQTLADPERDAGEATVEAVAAAREAVEQVPWTTRIDRAEPSCTLVCAVCAGREIVVGWVGDSRAYWIQGTGASQLTVDESWAEQQIDEGLLSPEQALRDPRSHAITNWVGGDAPARPPRLTTLRPDGAGRLILCTDGLWNYAPTTAELTALLDVLPADAAPVTVARTLTDAALAKGGHDNITVAVVDFDPSQGGSR